MILHFLLLLSFDLSSPSVIGRLPLTHRTMRNHELGTEQLDLKGGEKSSIINWMKYNGMGTLDDINMQ